MQKHIALVIFLILFGCCVFHALHYHPELPDQVPSNFSTAGKVQGWTQKTDLIIIYLVVAAGTAVFLPGMGFVMARLSPSSVNIPNKEYWLSPERERETLNYVAC
ncbi:MAG: DUF1648 domain-containing protein, partial [bacterium]|nr:DUF1648 domain-containing protein [bacterium]